MTYSKVLCPILVLLCPEVIRTNEEFPIAMLLAPVLLLGTPPKPYNASEPIAILLLPEIRDAALYPIAILSDLSTA